MLLLIQELEASHARLSEANSRLEKLCRAMQAAAAGAAAGASEDNTEDVVQ